MIKYVKEYPQKLKRKYFLTMPVLVWALSLNATQHTGGDSTIRKHCIAGYINTYGSKFDLGPDCADYTGSNSCPLDSGPVNGVAAGWRGDSAVTWLIAQIEEQYKMGIRKIMINRPMGGSGTSHVVGAAWLTIPAYKRNKLKQQLKPWLAAHPDLVLGIFIGSRWIETDSLMGYTDGMGLYPGITNGFDPQVPTEINAWHEVIDPWYDIGVRWVLIDYGSSTTNKDWLIRLAAYEKNLRDIEITGEAIPETETHYKQASWIALAPKFIDNPLRIHTNQGPYVLNDSNGTWYAWLKLKDLDSTINPETYIQTLVDRGYTIVASTSDLTLYATLQNIIDSCDVTSAGKDTSTTGMRDMSRLYLPVFTVFPNPSSDEVVYSFQTLIQGEYRIDVSNVLGASVFSDKISASIGEHTGKINLKHFGKGCYSITLSNSHGSRWNKKIIVY